MKNEGKQLEEYIFQQRINISDLAAALGVARSTIYKYYPKDRLPLAIKKAISAAIGVFVFEIWPNSEDEAAKGIKPILQTTIEQRLEDLDARIKRLEAICIRKFPRTTN